VVAAVLGAPGSGKSACRHVLAALLEGHAVLDWDALIDAAGELAGTPIAFSPRTWPAYRSLVRATVAAVEPLPVVLLTVCTPRELEGSPIENWVLLDCEDSVRRARLLDRPGAEVEDAIKDAREYRKLGFRTIDTTHKRVDEVAAAIAKLV
jgi:hypothetical protein